MGKPDKRFNYVPGNADYYRAQGLKEVSITTHPDRSGAMKEFALAFVVAETKQTLEVVSCTAVKFIKEEGKKEFPIANWERTTVQKDRATIKVIKKLGG